MQDLKIAMKSGDTFRRDTIRSLRSAIKKVEIDTRKILSNEEVIAIIGKQAKQRRDSIVQFQQGNRSDLVEQESHELAIIEEYLPKQLSDEEITGHAKTAIAELEAKSMRDMGTVMKRLTTDLKGIADGKRISQIVKSLLSL